MRHLLTEWFHPAGWSEERLRLVVHVAAVLGASVVVAWAAGFAFRRWIRRGVAASAEPQVAELVRGLRRTVLLVGLYEAARALPLHAAVAPLVVGLLFALAVLAAARVAVRAVRLSFQGWLEHTADGVARDRARREYLPLASSITTVGVGLLASILVAHHFGYEVSSLVAAFGVGSLAIGLASQQTLGNMVAGFTLLGDRPFGPGDRVRLQSGEEGEVLEIGLRSTRILLPRGNLLIVPNAEMANTRVVNQSYPAPSARCEVKLRVGWDADVERMSELLADLAHAQPETLTQPAPAVTLAALDGKGLELVLALQVASPDERDVVEERIRRALVKRLVDVEPDEAPDPGAPVVEAGVARTTRSKV
jgi:small-conductance mechanosensitive channel